MKAPQLFASICLQYLLSAPAGALVLTDNTVRVLNGVVERRVQLRLSHAEAQQLSAQTRFQELVKERLTRRFGDEGNVLYEALLERREEILSRSSKEGAFFTGTIEGATTVKSISVSPR